MGAVGAFRSSEAAGCVRAYFLGGSPLGPVTTFWPGGGAICEGAGRAQPEARCVHATPGCNTPWSWQLPQQPGQP